MPDSQSTAGPWHVTEGREGMMVTRGIANTRVPIIAKQIALTADDARLIAAAPDLLAALERYIDVDSTDDEIQAQGRAAIRKARGQ